jgi:hypothetical protein
MAANDFCHYCGTKYESQAWPRVCKNTDCNREVYDSPNVVGVGIIPMGDGILGGVRGIKGYGYGKRALLGGFSEKGESIEETCAREAFEEILSFCIYDDNLDESLIANAVPCAETLEVVKLAFTDELAFPLHNEAVAKYQVYRERVAYAAELREKNKFD